MSMLQRCVPNSFQLPHEVFELGLSHGPLLVYISLVYCKSLRHGADALSSAAISKLVGLCGKTVRTHLRALESESLIQVANSGGKFTCALCPIQNIVEKRCARSHPDAEDHLAVYAAEVADRRDVQCCVLSAQ